MIVLPGVVTLAIVKWCFGTVAGFTDWLLFFLPYWLDPKLIYVNGESGAMFWYWSLLAFVFAAFLVTIIGVLARYYIGKRLIALADNVMLRVPLLNKIYGTIKQVDDAFSSGKKNSFQTVVLVEYPRPGIYSVGFITSEQCDEVSRAAGEQCVAVFIPTTPIPTSGYLALIPKKQVTKLDMTVAEGFKYIISLGALSQDAVPPKIK